MAGQRSTWPTEFGRNGWRDFSRNQIRMATNRLGKSLALGGATTVAGRMDDGSSPILANLAHRLAQSRFARGHGRFRGGSLWQSQPRSGG